MDSETQEALRQLERTIVDQLHKVQLETSRVAGELGTLTSRFESENGHARRELGEALKGVEDLRRGQEQQRERLHEATLQLRDLQGLVNGTKSKVDSLAADVGLIREVDSRVSEIEVRGEERAKVEARRDLNIRGRWTGLIAAGAKLLWDTFGPHRQ